MFIQKPLPANVVNAAAAAAAASEQRQRFDVAHRDHSMDNEARPGSRHMVRVTMHMPASLRVALKRYAVDRDTTMSALIRRSITLSLQNPDSLAALSMGLRRLKIGSRTTLDLPVKVHRILKVIAAEKATSTQALVFAAIIRTYPELKHLACA
jgi:hypothetical protein